MAYRGEPKTMEFLMDGNEMECTKLLPQYTPQNQTSLQETALGKTLEAVRGLRDECFCDDINSRSGLLLGQACLVLERLQHGIVSDRGAFLSLLRVAGLGEEEKRECQFFHDALL